MQIRSWPQCDTDGELKWFVENWYCSGFKALHQQAEEALEELKRRGFQQHVVDTNTVDAELDLAESRALNAN